MTALTKSPITPCLTYRDAPAAIDFLCRAFGCETKLVVPGEGDTIAHAELTLGDGMIMLGSPRDNAFNRLQSTPKALRGVSQSPYIVVDDAQAVFDKVALAGGMIVGEMQHDTESGDSFFCYDPEGYLWCIGTYNPWHATVRKQQPTAVA